MFGATGLHARSGVQLPAPPLAVPAPPVMAPAPPFAEPPPVPDFEPPFALDPPPTAVALPPFAAPLPPSLDEQPTTPQPMLAAHSHPANQTRSIMRASLASHAGSCSARSLAPGVFMSPSETPAYTSRVHALSMRAHVLSARPAGLATALRTQKKSRQSCRVFGWDGHRAALRPAQPSASEHTHSPAAKLTRSRHLRQIFRGHADQHRAHFLACLLTPRLVNVSAAERALTSPQAAFGGLLNA